MPMAAKHHCPKGHPAHYGQCPLCKQERKARADKRRPGASKRGGRGYDYVWQQIRAEHLRQHPNCVKCGDKATVVDHVIPHRGDRRLLLDRSNLQSLCQSHHASWKQAIERREAAQQAGKQDPWA